ncbi:hypothetical protein GWK48_10240 [Metallosphaera tengchongensis]|uniref:Uncharacterized protein n=1 Tax=Metallosphaera tengchongensis TaxID=1532350 RepID=A0A6N0NWZ4_9CREN|nr:hypothetical protein [Metallosphaera tengchongensis]QKR00715.1 hypothetical protein GWK48_10240 [Metallosphaera tengchongensis]
MRCRSEQCREISSFLERRDGTLDVVYEAPRSNPSFRRYVRKIITDQEGLLKGVVLGEDISNSMWTGYKNATLGFLRSAEESNRFIIERACLSVLVSETSEKYLELLKTRRWHVMVDSGYTIRNERDALRSVRRFLGREVRLDRFTIYLAGEPTCERHLMFPRYSISVKELESSLHLKVRAKCRKCSRDAKYFTLAMPKASALMGLATHIRGMKGDVLKTTYSNISRIIHPYGFNDLEKDRVFTLWARDLLTVLREVNRLLVLGG